MALLLFAAACAGSRGGDIDLAQLTPQDVVSRIEQNQNRLQSLNGRGLIVIEIPGSPFRGDVKIRVTKPDSLFIVTEAAFGIDVGFLFADGQRFESYSPIDNIHFTGPVEKVGQMIFFQFEVGYQELLNAVTGTANFPLDTSAQVSLDGSRFLFQQPFQESTLRYKVDGDKFVITEMELLNDDGEVIFRQVFKRFRKVKNIWLPFYTQLMRPQARERLTVHYSSIDINVPIPPQEFVYKIPESARHRTLE